MSDRFRPLSMEQLAAWAFTELAEKDSLFNVPRRAFFVPRADHRFRVRQFGIELDTPFGVAAGPHTQMAQNIVAAWLVGARVIELKTVQTLDEIEVHKPCIDVEDEGYNVEWSQELRVHESFDEYLRAWVLIHALHRRFGWPGERPGVLFNMSVGYNLEGIRRPNVQWYLDAMADASAWLPAYVDIVARYEPSIREVDIPARLSNTMTLSTMHGCPPGEIERITRYLLEERHLHTSVKCNPTLLGAERVRGIVNGDLGYADVRIPDAAFGHDLRWDDAVPMFRNLRGVAAAHGLAFGLKLSNTLEVENTRAAFPHDPTMYLSGRALHAVTVNLASRIAQEFAGELPLSFAGGADCFNVADLLRSGVRSVTVTSDLLKTGGYLRMLQYMEHVDTALDETGAADIPDFVCASALRLRDLAPFAGLVAPAGLTARQAAELLVAIRTAPPGVRRPDAARGWAVAAGLTGDRAELIADAAVRALARLNLRAYAAAVRSDWRYRKASFRTDRSKTARPLGLFDCIAAPCAGTCPVDQAVPRYMDAVRRGDIADAIRIVRADNPLPAVLGRVCDHLCEPVCVRTHLDQPLAIRQIKRFIMDQETDGAAGSPEAARGHRVAIIGAGPAGLAAAEELGHRGFGVTVLEAHPYPGGMVGGAIPSYRLPQAQIDQDLAVLRRLGVEIRYGVRAGSDVTIDGLRDQGFEAVFVAVGAQLGRRLGLPGEDADGILDGVAFLRGVREGHPPRLGRRVGVIGAGDTAMDCARSALRTGADAVSLIYRRTVDQMPADPEEVHATVEEGVEIVELARPVGLRVVDGKLAGVVCLRTEYRDARDASGRRIPFDVPGSEFEIPLDTLVLAISQHMLLDCFGDAPPALTADGYIAVDPDTLETSIPGVYAGGDASAHGPASIVRAAADGKRAARAIAAAFGVPEATTAAAAEPVDLHEMALRRARRDYRVPIWASPLERGEGFDETVLGYTREEAMREAARCLDCDRACSLCVGVCPNAALMTYEVEPLRAELPVLVVANGVAVERARTTFETAQRPQVAVLADLCNACGTCVTACPTSGSPYRDKPRLYLDRADFRAEESNAFLLLGPTAMAGRFEGRTHRIELDGRFEYTAPSFSAVLDPRTFHPIEATPTDAAEGETLSLEPAAIMATLLLALRRSMPHLPHAADDGTRVRAPRLG